MKMQFVPGNCNPKALQERTSKAGMGSPTHGGPMLVQSLSDFEISL